MSDLEPSGGFQMPDMGSLLQSAQQMQEQLLAAQAAAAAAVVEGQAGGGVVKVVVNGSFEFESVTIDPQVVDADDVEMLQDLVLAALHDAVAQLNDQQQSSMGGFDLSAISGFDLGGLLGGAGEDEEE